jgi:glyoxylase-like metal-dependent hydrolase (beta-lactamase superfamily II)
MVEEILKNLYRIEIPLHGNPLKSINCYVIKSSERDMIIDTGWNREECITAMNAGLRELDVDLTKTDLFITHLHADHIGLAPKLATDTSKVYFNKPEADWIVSGGQWHDFIDYARVSGFPESELQAILQSNPGTTYRSQGRFDFTILEEHDTLSAGEYRFECVATPGHTFGHMCLYEPTKKMFVSGDHILNDITPTIQLWSDGRNPLKEYQASLDKVYEFDIELVLPGHRSIFRNCKERIQELKHHHQKRSEEILSILEEGSRDAFEVASQMSWDITCDSWDLFPVFQKWFATGEAIAHLKFLEEQGRVRRENRDQNIVYSLI